MRYSDILNINQILKTNCSEILNIYQKVKPIILYRGFKTKKKRPDFFKGRSIENRRTKQIPMALQRKIDKVLIDMNSSVLRSNSYFATSNYIQADFYGKVYKIFPVNGFKYLWFKKSRDLFDHFYDFPNPKKASYEEIESLVLSLEPIYNSEIIEAIKSENEIMFVGSYYAVDLTLSIDLF